MKKKGVNKTTVLVIIIILLCAGGYYYFNVYNNTPVGAVDNFALITNFYRTNGYTCQNLSQGGSNCSRHTENNTYQFFRYDDGLQYIYTSKNYKITITSRTISNEVSIQTYNGAFEGYREKKYYCDTDTENILGSLTYCRTQDNELLDNEVYLTMVRNSLNEINEALEQSGFIPSNVVNDHEWVK